VYFLVDRRAGFNVMVNGWLASKTTFPQKAGGQPRTTQKSPAGRSAGLLAPDALSASGMSVALGSVKPSAGLHIGLEVIDILQADVKSQRPARRAPSGRGELMRLHYPRRFAAATT
jgi:hypothetical protein